MLQQLKLPLSYAADLHGKNNKYLDNCLEHSEKTQGLTRSVFFCEQHRLWIVDIFYGSLYTT